MDSSTDNSHNLNPGLDPDVLKFYLPSVNFAVQQQQQQQQGGGGVHLGPHTILMHPSQRVPPGAAGVIGHNLGGLSNHPLVPLGRIPLQPGQYVNPSSSSTSHYASAATIMSSSAPGHQHHKSFPTTSIVVAPSHQQQQHGRTPSGPPNLLTHSTQQTQLTSGQTQHAPHSAPILRASTLITLLQRCIVLLSGGRDRRGGPILTFPAKSHADELPLEDLYLLVRYYTYLPEERIKKMGFTVIVDMRNGTTWQSVKPLLKVLEECIGRGVEITYIIKPEKFLEKQRASLSATKYSFDVMLISQENLLKEIDASQLTVDVGGTLDYQHKEWLHLRLSLEEFFSLAHDMCDKFSQVYTHMDRLARQGEAAAALTNNSTSGIVSSSTTSSQQQQSTSNTSSSSAITLSTSAAVAKAKQNFEEHKSLHSRVYQAPVRLLEKKAELLVHWLRYGFTNNPQGQVAALSWISRNPDFQILIPQVNQTITQLHEHQRLIQKKWETERVKLEQLYQLHLFKDDLGRMGVWLQQQRQLFLTEYLDIGHTASQAADLHSEHRHFLHNCSEVREQVTRLTSIARMLAESGHFASSQILSQASELDHEWKCFTTALEDRSRVLQLSASFHARAEAFLANCPHWESSMRQLRGDTIPALNQALITLQDLWHEAQTAHDEVCLDGRALATHLSSPVPRGSHTSLTAAVDYSEGRRHCADLVHELWSWFKRLEAAHNERRKRIAARLSLLIYKGDVQQVLAWLCEHGEPFLQRQTCVGKSVQRAEQLYNAHMQFVQVASNTLTNAEKLISAADDLAAQADDPEEILQEATSLQRRISTFTNNVRERRDNLDLACGFYSHVKDLFAYLQRVRDCQNPGEHLPPSIEGMEEELHSFNRDKKTMESAYERVCQEGKMLSERMSDPDEIQHLRSLLLQVVNERNIAQEIFTERQIRLDLCLQLRLFEADVSQAIHCLRCEVPLFDSVPTGEDGPPQIAPGRHQQDETIHRLEEELSRCQTACKIAEDVYQKGSELLTAFDQVQVNFPAGGPGSSDSGVGDSVEYAVERVQRMLQELQDFLHPVDQMKERFSLELEWRRAYEQSRHVLHWIRNGESLLHSTALIPGNLNEADQLKTDNENFQESLNKAHPEVISSATRLEYLLHKCATRNVHTDQESQINSSSSGGGGGIDQGARLHKERRKESVCRVMEEVTTGWQTLVHVVEEKHKLLTTAVNWYKISDQVFSVLQSLEKDYRRDEEWCQNYQPNNANGSSLTEYMNGLLAKHAAQKESFLKACILGRRTSESFLKYLTRQPNGTTGKLQMDKKTRSTMAELMKKEQAVLEAWASRKRRIDECVHFLNFKRDVEILLSNVAAIQANVKNSTNDNVELRKALEPPLKVICETAETFEFLYHGPLVKKLMLKVKVAFPQFSCSNSFLSSASVYDTRTNRSSGAPSVISEDSGVSSDRTSTSTSATSPVSNCSALDQKLLNRRENLLRELIQTEQSYVRDLKDCLNTYRTAMEQPATLDLQLPSGIQSREDTIFCNMRAIYEFHEIQFLPELQKYAGGFLPEDVGHCFVSHAEKLASLYVEYCVNKTDSSQLIIDEAGTFFIQVQQKLKLSEPLQSYLIKPVQRITKYQLLLKELLDCCDPGSAGELKEGMESMLSVPKKANDALHLSMLQGTPTDCDLSSLGEVLLQEELTVWEPKQLIKKSRTRRVFLFDSCVILSKEVSNAPGEHKKRYQFKSRLMLAEFNIKEHFEGDQCKFALWSGRVPPSVEYRLILRAPNLDTKQAWVRALREAIQERVFTMQNLYSNEDHSANASARTLYSVTKDYKYGTFSVTTNQRVEVLEHRGDQCLVRIPLTQQESLMPCNLLMPVSASQSAAAATTAAAPRRGSTANLIVRKLLPNSAGGGGGASSSGNVNRKNSSSTPDSQESRIKPLSVNKMLATPKSNNNPDNSGLLSSTSEENGSSVTSNNATAANAAAASSTAMAFILDNVSEESVEVELPPPMELQQDLPAVPCVGMDESATEETEDDTEDNGSNGLSSDCANTPAAAVVAGTHAAAGAAAASSSRQPLLLRPHETLSSSTTTNTTTTTNVSSTTNAPHAAAVVSVSSSTAAAGGCGSGVDPMGEQYLHSYSHLPTSPTPLHQQQPQQSGLVNKETDELGVALAKNLRLSHRSKQRLLQHNAKLQALSLHHPMSSATSTTTTQSQMVDSRNSPNRFTPPNSPSMLPRLDEEALTPGPQRNNPFPPGIDPHDFQGNYSLCDTTSATLLSNNTMTSSTSSSSATTLPPGGGGSGGGGGVGNNQKSSAMDQLWQRRCETLSDLVTSEEVYVEKLMNVLNHWIPALERRIIPAPDELIVNWTVLWGNWHQLAEWHSCFLQRLQSLLAQHDDNILTMMESSVCNELTLSPPQFTTTPTTEDSSSSNETNNKIVENNEFNKRQQLDHRYEIEIANLFKEYAGRLRVMYSKYCENHAARAQVYLERYNDWFEQLRQHLNAREELSYFLLQPLERIATYSVPLQEMVRLSRKVHCPQIVVEAWQRAHTAIKSVPAKTQLIMEAARISGYEGKIFNLGDLRMSDTLRVACTRIRPDNNQTNHDNELDCNFEWRRVFLFEQALLLTEVEQRKTPFSSSGNETTTTTGSAALVPKCNYRFLVQVNINRMRLHIYWPDNNSKETSSSGLNDHAQEQILSQINDKSLSFGVSDAGFGSETSVIFDPSDMETRTLWLRELNLMQRMQKEILQRLATTKQQPALSGNIGGMVSGGGHSGIPLYRASPMPPALFQRNEYHLVDHLPHTPTNIMQTDLTDGSGGGGLSGASSSSPAAASASNTIVVAEASPPSRVPSKKKSSGLFSRFNS